MAENCIICQRPQAYVHCGICKGALCKRCEHFVPVDRFAFLEAVPEELKLGHYCPSCFDADVGPAETKYEETMARARDVNIFFSADRNVPRLLAKAKNPVHIKNCTDRDETILRLGFRAAEMGFNSVVKVEVTAKQIRNLTHQKSSWQGTGLPANIDLKRYFGSPD